MSTFGEPWEAQVFALAVTLLDRGVLDPGDWAEALGAELAAGDRDATGEDYYAHWLSALERMVCERGLVDAGTLAGYRTAWARAAERTPHGTPIELAPSDFT